MRRGAGVRCHGYVSDDGAAAYCARIESGKQAGDVWRHWLYGACDCGATHGRREDAPPEIRERREQRKPNGAAGRSRPAGERPPKPPAPWTVPAEHVEMIHRYEDPECGALLFEVARIRREYRDRHDGARTLPRYEIDGRWYWGAGPWAGRSEELPLYRQREAVAELVQGGTVRLVEGERDADAIHVAGGVGTCNAWGAGKFRDAHARTLAAALAGGAPSALLEVVVDQDGDGRRHAQDVLRRLRAAGAPRDRIRTVRPASGKDAAEHLAAGHALEDFEPFALENEEPEAEEPRAREAAPSLGELGFSGPRLLALLSRERPAPVEAGRPAPGHFALVIAPTMIGKTTLALWNAMARASGVAPWDGATARPARRVLIYSIDEAPEQVARRLHGLATFHPAGRLPTYADRIVVIGPDREIDPAALDALRFDDAGLATLTRWLAEAEAAGEPFAEVYVDAYADMIPLGASENSNEEATRIGGALERLAVRSGAAITMLHHAGKPKADAGEEPDVRFLGRGASALAAKARVVASLEAVPGLPHLRRIRTLTNLGPAPRSMLFAVCDPEGPTEELLFFRPAPEPQDREPGDFLAPGEVIPTNELARRLAGDSLPDDRDPPGELKKQAAALRERWQEAGLVTVTRGKKGAKLIQLAAPEEA